MLTIIIPTKNRSQFLGRLLKYFAETKCKYCIIIGDSSGPEHLTITKRVINRLKDKLNIIHYEFPELDPAACMRELFKSVSTPYAVNLPDDDFLVPGSLEKCVHFLETNPEYCGAHGVGVLVELELNGPHGNIKGASEYRLASIEDPSAVHRLLNYLRNYSVAVFSVYRTVTWMRLMENAHALNDPIFSGELLPGCLSVLLGKIKKIDCLYLVRQTHKDRSPLPNFYDWITSENWGHSYRLFNKILQEALLQKDNIDEEQAQLAINMAFRYYAEKMFRREFLMNGSILRKTKQNFKKLLACFPALIVLLKKARAYLVPLKTISLERISNSRSSYYADFVPIYRALTSSENTK